jgi:hypothetical protein
VGQFFLLVFAEATKIAGLAASTPTCCAATCSSQSDHRLTGDITDALPPPAQAGPRDPSRESFLYPDSLLGQLYPDSLLGSPGLGGTSRVLELSKTISIHCDRSCVAV